MYPERQLQHRYQLHSVRRHYNQAHRKTSLFGSENEEQVQNNSSPSTSDNAKNASSNTGDEISVRFSNSSENFIAKPNGKDIIANGSYSGDSRTISKENRHIESECNQRSRESQIQSLSDSQRDGLKHNLGVTTNSNQFKEMMHAADELVRAANNRARLREELKATPMEQSNGDNKQNSLRTPWHTDFDAETDNGSKDIAERIFFGKKRSDNIVNNAQLRNSSTQNLHPVNQNRLTNEQSVPPTEDGLKTYQRHRPNMGSSFFNLFGVSGWNGESCKDGYRKKKEDECANPSSLRFTPYAQHYE